MKQLVIFLLFFSTYTSAQKSEIFHIDSLPTEGVLLNKGWKYQAGDNPDWAKPDFEDSAWESIDPTKPIPELSEIKTDSPLWLRLKFTSEINQEVVISIIQSGASEIFLNGKLIFSLGQIEQGNKMTVAYDPQNDASILKLDTHLNTLAVRYYFQKDMRYNSVFNVNFPLFSARINNKISQSNIDRHVWNGFNIGVPLILFIVHFIFFLSYTRNKTNLFYSLSSFFGCIGTFLLFKVDITHSIESKNHLTNYAAFAGAFQNIFLYYTIFLFLKHKNKWLVVVFIGIVLLSLLLYSSDYFQSSVLASYIITLFYVFSVIYMGNQAWKQGEKGGKYLILGMVFYIVFWSLFILSFTFNWGSLSADILFHLATLVIPIIISALLGLDFRNTNNSLLKNLEKVNALSIEKQQILSSQNETLEKQVTERTAELNHSLFELKATQNQLIQKEKLASLGELTAGIAHEIQNPLNFVNNFSELSVDLAKDLNDEIHKSEIDKGYIEELLTDLTSNQEKINHHGKRASNIVKGMLEHSRASTGVKELTDINKLADEYLRLAYHGLRAKDKDFIADYELIIDENLPKIEVIPQDMGRVLLNLINNAFYAVSEKKKQNTEGVSYNPTVTVSTQQIDNQIVIKVKDNGMGMSESVRAKVFQPFFTTKPTGQGTGLGLSLAYDIVTKGHGGTLKVESTEGVGSEFIITLPFKTNV